MTTKYKCLLIDDEPPALEILKRYISSMPMLEIHAECNHAIAAYEFLRTNNVDVIFLDIQMPQLLGTELLKTLKNPPKVIFTTAFRDYALDGFELGAVDYLLKPYSFDRFLRAVHKVLELEHTVATPARESLTTHSDKFLYVRSDRKMVKVMVDEIEYIESLKDYLKISTRDQQIITKQTISSIQEMLPEQEFCRIHRSFIVSTRRIDSFDQHNIFIRKTELPIGPLYRQEIMKRLNRLQ